MAGASASTLTPEGVTLTIWGRSARPDRKAITDPSPRYCGFWKLVYVRGARVSRLAGVVSIAAACSRQSEVSSRIVAS
jgi:hypothetical protein